MRHSRMAMPVGTVLVASALIATFSEAPAQEKADTARAFTAALTEATPVDPAVRVGSLDNGLRYYVRENGRPEQRAELRLAVNAGSVLEDDDQRGLAHFVEHMAFNGTEHFAKQELVDYLESIGMQFGPDINASTSFDETVYTLTVPTDSAVLVETAFQILEDWAHGIAFDSVEVEKERGVVLEEWRLGQGAFARIRDKQFPVLFRDSRYAERLPIGLPEIITGADHEALKRFYRDWYRPDLMAVIAVGDFDADSIEGQIRRHFQSLRDPDSPRARSVFDVPEHDEMLFAIASDPELTVSTVSVIYKLPLGQDATLGDYRRSLVERTYNSMLNFRFYEITQGSEDPPFLFASSDKGRLVRSGEVYSLGAAVRDGEIERGLARILLEGERVSRFGFTEAELERQKADMLRAYERGFMEREKTESNAYAAEYVRAFLVREPIPGIAYEYALVRRFLPGITLTEVNRIARKWISDRNRVILVASPEKEGLKGPVESELAAVFEEVRAAEIRPYQDEAAEGPLLTNLAAPGRIVEESAVDEIGVTEWRLENGVRVLLKPTDYKEDQVLFYARSPGGTSLAPDEEYLSAAWAATVVSMGGIGELSAVDLQKRLAGKIVSVGPTVGELQEGLSGNASPQDLETLFQLIYLNFTAPRRDSTAFLSFVSRMRTVLENRSADPEAVYSDSLSVILSQGHFRRRPPTPEMLDEIDLDRALAFYRERFADAGDFVFTFVGSFEPDTIRPLVERYLGALPAAGRAEKWRDVGVEPPAGIIRQVLRKGLEPKGRTTLVFTGPFEFERRNRYLLQSTVEVLRIMLRETLREDLGGTYGVSVNAAPTRDPKTRYSLRISFGADPERLEELTRAAFVTIDSLAAYGASDENLAKVKEMQRRQRETDLKENGFWLSIIDYYDRYGEDLGLIAAYDQLVQGLTGEAIGEAARAYLPPDRFVQVSLVPEEAEVSETDE